MSDSRKTTLLGLPLSRKVQTLMDDVSSGTLRWSTRSASAACRFSLLQHVKHVSAGQCQCLMSFMDNVNVQCQYLMPLMDNVNVSSSV